MRLPVFLSAALMVLATGVNASASVTFTLDSYTVSANSGSGLLIETANILPEPTSLTALHNIGDMYTADLFRIWTDETDVGTDDRVPKDISVDFNFSAPAPAFGGSAEGATVGGSFLIFQGGRVDWDNPTDILFGPNGDGVLRVELSDEVFNVGAFGIKEGRRYGKNVKAKFTLVTEASPGDPPPGGVPEPSMLAVWSLLCVSGLLSTRRRRS